MQGRAKRDRVLQVRCELAEREVWRRAAVRRDESLAQFTRRALNRLVAVDLRDHDAEAMVQ